MTGVKKTSALLAIVVALGANASIANTAEPGKLPRVGLFWLDSRNQPRIDEFRRALRDLGYVEGSNIVLEYRDAGGKHEKLPSLAAELVRLRVDVILSDGGAVIRALQDATKTTPIIMPVMSDPIAGGFVAKPVRPEGNITGLTNFAPELSGKRLELLKETVPRVTRVAILWSSAPVQEAAMKTLETAARSLKVELQSASTQRGSKDLDTVLEAVIKGRSHALLTLPDPRLGNERERIVRFALKNRLPTIFATRGFAEAGGLMSYGPDFSYNFRRAATYVDKILKGTKVQDLPVENPMKFELIINLKTATAIGVNIPPKVLMWADKVIK